MANYTYFTCLYEYFLQKKKYFGDYSCSTYTKFFEKLIFLTPWYAHVEHVCLSEGKKF